MVTIPTSVAGHMQDTFATWLEDAAIPVRVIDELMATGPPEPAARRLVGAPSGPSTGI
jgi:hypothetical protein